MYKLTLTSDERKAIDWIGYRYSNGDDLYNLLMADATKTIGLGAWDEDKDITFLIPENIAWEIRDNAEKEDGDFVYNFPCFDNDLSRKMINFCLDKLYKKESKKDGYRKDESNFQDI
jgi:hypothetical protein